MTMQAFAIVVRSVEFDRLMRFADVLHVEMMQPAEFCFDSPGIKRVVGVAGVTSFVARYPIVLIVRCGDIAGVIHQQAPAVISHDVAGKAEGGLLGALNMILQAQQATKEGEDKKRQKGEYLSTTGYCDLRPRND